MFFGFRCKSLIRIQVKCFCCSNDHVNPRTGEKLPCDRVLVLGMLERWFRDTEAQESYLESFNGSLALERAPRKLRDGARAFERPAEQPFPRDAH